MLFVYNFCVIICDIDVLFLIDGFMFEVICEVVDEMGWL